MTAGRPPEGPPEVAGSAAQPRRGCSWALVGLLAALAVAAVLLFLRAMTSEPGPPPPLCLSNVKNIALAFQMYLADNGDTFPPADGWCDRINECVKNRDIFRCPQAEGPDGDFAYNAALDGVSVASLSNRAGTVVIFESDRGWNAVGGRELLPDEPRHLGGDNYGFADGHSEWHPRKKNHDGTWAKEPEADVIWEAVVEAREPGQ